MTSASIRVARRLAAVLALTALIGSAGCGPARHPVAGRVAYEDGSPLTEGSVIGETTAGGQKVMAQGAVRPDGTFEWGTGRPGDGATAGKYRVIVVPRALGDAEMAAGQRPAVDAKYTQYDTSGIEFEVKEGKNELNITVSKPKAEPAPKPEPEPDPKPDPSK